MDYSVNDIVKIVNSGHQYDKFSSWAREHGFFKEWSLNRLFKTVRNDLVDDKYIVRVADFHNPKYSKKIIYGIENIRTGEYHIISSEGLGLVSKMFNFGIDDSLFEL